MKPIAVAGVRLVLIGRWDMYKSGAGNGVGVCRYDAQTGALEAVRSVLPDVTVGAVCLNAERTLLYCVDERATLPGYFQGGGGRVFALAIDRETGTLVEINHQPSFGSAPAGVALDPTGKYLIVVHHTGRTPVTKVVEEERGHYRIALDYDDATTVLFPLGEDGSIGEPCDVYIHWGDGGPLARQTHPQLHSIARSPSGNLFLVSDKGNDEILFFGIKRKTHKLERRGAALKSPAGSSPRYFVFHPTCPYLFVNHETKAMVSAVRYDENGGLATICTVSALPDDREDDPDMKQSDIVIDPSGRRLYSLIRGISAVSVFEIDGETGSIARVQTVQLDGVGPRGCAISPDGRFLLIAALTSNEVLLWAIAEDGTLSPTGRKTSQPNPGIVTFC